MSIEENNKIIGEFMVPNWKDLKSDKYTGTIEGQSNIWVAVCLCSENYFQLKYHKSYDWLIPVIDKITSSDWYIEAVEDMSGQFEFKIEINTKFILSTLETVVEFIKWYNENKRNKEK